uniref:Putative secreted protein n=1 Tax=Ixodes ricinus TaxID=34613 RepID=A0A6B0TZJ4_IXORI
MGAFTVALFLSLVLMTLGMVANSPRETEAAAEVLPREAAMELEEYTFPDGVDYLDGTSLPSPEPVAVE